MIGYYNTGYSAFEHGAHYLENPFAPNSLEFELWDSGWWRAWQDLLDWEEL